MRSRALFFLILILLMGSATALDPVNVAITSSNGWLVANEADSAVITVTVTDGAAHAIKDAGVSLAATGPWALESTDGMTSAGGVFVTRFLPTKKSGISIITASVTVDGVTTVPVVGTYTQNILADTPALQEKSYESAVTVGSLTEISVLVTDRHGNPVDSRKKLNEVRFQTTLKGDNAFLDDTMKKVKTLSVALNEEGIAGADFIVSTKPGDNFVVIEPPKPLPMSLLSIQGVSDGIPATITWVVIPEGNPPTLITDEESKFIIKYQLSDKYGNPTVHQELSISSNLGEKKVISSNNEGMVTATYGPKRIAGRYTITAVALANPAVTVTQILRFASDDPTDMLLTASPQSMPSLDVNKDVVSRVMAKVVDSGGNPVQGQTVSFSIQSVNAGAAQTSDPFIESGNKKTSTPGIEIISITDGDGIAAVDFYPGAFVKDSPMAEGIATIRARWAGVTSDIDLSYKNYPYLSVSTSVEPMTVEKGGEVNISIRLRGDGYALLPKPVDAFLVTDRSGSMGQDTPTRLSRLKNAATVFTTKFDYTDDRLGQFSFGGKTGTYGDYATLDQKLTSKMTQVQGAISALTSGGYTPMRYALKKSIEEMSKSGRSEAIRALVLMSDGDYNYWGDPLARGNADTKGNGYDSKYQETIDDYIFFPDIDAKYHDLAYQNMATYAKEYNIRIYTIGYAADITDVGRGTLEELATSTGGKYFYALSGDELTGVYEQIAGDLKDAAGVGTTMELDFQQVEVNGLPMDGDQVFTYVHREMQSTWIVPPSGSGSTFDSTADWNDDHRLSFDFGTIKMEEEWVVNFTLKVNGEGNIKALGDTSRVLFDEGKGILTIPDTYFTAVPEGKDGGLGSLTLKITILSVTIPQADKNSARVAWAITYDGDDESIEEVIALAAPNSDVFGTYDSQEAGNDQPMDAITLKGLSPGSYRVRVTGSVGDADSSWDIAEFSIPDVSQTPVIRIR